MKTLAFFALAIAMGTGSSRAQDASGSLPAAPGLHLTSYKAVNTVMPERPLETASVVAAQPAAPRAARTADSKFFLLNGSLLGMAVFDVEMTQRCIADQHCRELNPLMPSSHAGQLGLDLGLVAGVSGATYWLKKHKSPLWWLPSATGIGAHAAGVTTGFEHQ
jgi:hypothetical protein